MSFVSKQETTHVISIVGPSGSGKTTLTDILVKQLMAKYQQPSGDEAKEMKDDHGAVIRLSEDSYYKPQTHVPLQARAKINFDEPGALDLALLAQQLKDLKQGKTVEVPEYDFTKHDRKDSTTRLDGSKIRVIIVEGLFSWCSDAVTGQVDYKFFVNTQEIQCLFRRHARDMIERDRSSESIVAQFKRDVHPANQEYIYPCMSQAHPTINNNREWEPSTCNALKVEAVSTLLNAVSKFLQPKPQAVLAAPARLYQQPSAAPLMVTAAAVASTQQQPPTGTSAGLGQRS